MSVKNHRKLREKGKVTLEQYFDADGQQAVANNGFIGIERTFDSDGNLINETGIVLEDEMEGDLAVTRNIIKHGLTCNTRGGSLYI